MVLWKQWKQIAQYYGVYAREAKKSQKEEAPSPLLLTALRSLIKHGGHRSREERWPPIVGKSGQSLRAWPRGA